MLRMQGKTWAEINNEVFAEEQIRRTNGISERIVDRYKPLVMQKWREDLRRRWRAQSEAAQAEGYSEEREKR